MSRKATRIDFDVIIIGGGIVGATLACALGGSAFKVIVIEAKRPPRPPKKGHDLRVSAITRASEQVFRTLGAWDAMAARRVSPFRAMHVWDAGGGGEIHFDAADIGEPHLGHIVENTVIVAALIERLAAFDNVGFRAPAQVQSIDVGDACVTVVLKGGGKLRARLAVGADGAGSCVRRQARIETRGWSYGQTGIVATVATERSHEETAWQRFLPSGPLAFLPLADGRCSIVWSADTERAEALLDMEAETFARALGEAFGHRLGRIVTVGRRAAFPLALAHAEAYVRPRLALAGDAAHTIHPLAGQGANLGIADAAALAEVLVDAAAAGRDIGVYHVLRRYERWRKGENLLTAAVMDGFKRLFGTERAAVRAARNLGLALADAAAPIKNLVMRRATGLAGDLPKLARNIRL